MNSFKIFRFFIAFFLLISTIVGQEEDPTAEVVEPNNDDVSGSPSKEAVVQHPVTVSVHAPQLMTTRAPVAPLKTRVVVVHNNMVPVPIECFQPPDSGTCSKDMARIYYDHETRTCKPFSYTGCGGNANRFQSIKNCYRICHPYRYKIRPKVARSSQQQVKARVLPAQAQAQGFSPLAQAQRQAAQQRSLLANQQQAQAQQQQRSMYRQPQQQAQGYSGYPAQYQAQPYAQPYAQQQPYQQGYGQPQQRSYGGTPGGEISPLTQKHVVMTPGGPQVKNQPIGSGSMVPGNTGQMGGQGHSAQG